MQLNQVEIKIFRLLSIDPSDGTNNESELRESLCKLSLETLFSLINATGYSVLHLACSNFEGYYGLALLDIVTTTMKLKVNDSPTSFNHVMSSPQAGTISQNPEDSTERHHLLIDWINQKTASLRPLSRSVDEALFSEGDSDMEDDAAISDE